MCGWVVTRYHKRSSVLSPTSSYKTSARLSASSSRSLFHSARPPPPPRAVAISASADIQLKNGFFPLLANSTLLSAPSPVAQQIIMHQNSTSNNRKHVLTIRHIYCVCNYRIHSTHRVMYTNSTETVLRTRGRANLSSPALW